MIALTIGLLGVVLGMPAIILNLYRFFMEVIKAIPYLIFCGCFF